MVLWPPNRQSQYPRYRCTLSSAIASNLANGYDLDTSVERAKTYLSGALASMLDLGQGKGPLDHLFNLEGEFVK